MLRLFLGLTFNSGYTRRLCTLMEGVDGVDLNDRVAAWMSENIRH